MQPDAARAAEARSWLSKTASDLRAADHELTAAPPLVDDIVFHAQQAVEKASKGFLTWHNQPFRKTHDLVELGQACVDIDATLEPLLRRAAPLTEYAWKFRYPGEHEQPSESEAREALQLAHEVYRAMLSRVPIEVHP